MWTENDGENVVVSRGWPFYHTSDQLLSSNAHVGMMSVKLAVIEEELNVVNGYGERETEK